MAVIGLKMPIFAKIGTYVPGTRPTYTNGTVIAKAISADLTINTASAVLYADDAEDERDESFTSGNISFGINSMDYTAETLMFGSKMSASGGAAGEIIDAADDMANEGGFGYYRVHKINGARKYEAVWLLRTVFKKMDTSDATKGESIAFQTPTISGTIMRVDGYNGGVWRERKMFDTEEACVAYLKMKAGITADE